MLSQAAEAYFSQQFEKDLQQVGQGLIQQYAPLIKAYRQVIIPFERRRVEEHQSIIFENSSLQQNKVQLMGKIDRARAENDKMEHALELQRTRITDMEQRIEALEQANTDHLSVIESLRIRNDDYKEAIAVKNSSISQLQKDKAVLLEKYQAKEQEYNLVLANCMRDKNLLAEKLNALNDMEQNLLDKEKQLKAEKFYLQKQWEELEEAKKRKPEQTPKDKKEARIFKPEFVPSVRFDESNPYGQEQGGSRESKGEILRQPLRKLVKHHQSEIYDFSYNYNGNLLASCGGDRMIKIFDVHNMKNGPSILSPSPDSVFICVALDYSGERLLTGSTDKSVGIYSTQTGKLLHNFLGHGNKVNSVTWTSSRDRCVSGSDDKQLKVWDIEKASNVFSVTCHKHVKVIRSNNVEPVVFTGHGDGSVRVYSVNQGNSPVSQIKGVIDYAITSLTLLSNRHQVLATSLEGSTIHLLDLKMNKSVYKYDHKDFFNSSTHGTISPSESLVLAGNCDGSIYYWNLVKGDMVKKVTGHESSVTAINYHFMTSYLTSGDKDGSMILWQ